MKLHRKLVLAISGITVIAAAAGATVALASSGSGSTTTILGHRATLSNSVHVNEDRIKLQTKDPTDVQVQTITFNPHGFSGWHFHPGIVIVVVESGQITTHDKKCKTRTYGPHESFVESGTAPFMVSNESDTINAVVYATFVAPAGSPFRIETAPPPCAA
jgi:quercetin dioxygenase-like cupin family protein